MRGWDTDPSLRETEAEAASADVWCAIPKVVFSHTLDGVQGSARLARDGIALDLIETRTFGSRVNYERYRRARSESD